MSHKKLLENDAMILSYSNEYEECLSGFRIDSVY